MSKRTRIHPVQFYLNDDEQYILEEKYRLSRMKSKSAFLRKMILYGFVYEVDYSHIRKMNTLLGNISSNLNQITHRINSSNTGIHQTASHMSVCGHGFYLPPLLGELSNPLRVFW